MTDTVRLAWLSDVHLPLESFPLRYWNLKRVLGWLNWQRKRRFIHTRETLDMIVADMKAQNPDHILVSGDLINLGLPAEYQAAARWLATLGPPDRVSVVFGNHDNYVRGPAAMAGLPLWKAYAGNDQYGRSIDPHGPDSRLFPYVRRLGPVALIGVNSAIPTPVGFAHGTLGRAQLDQLAGLLRQTKADGLVRLVMIHHPPLPDLAPARRALLDAEALAAVLAAEGAEFVIHGHNHTETCATHAGIPVIGGASASAARAYGDEPAARYHLISLTREGANALIEIETRGLDTAARRIAPIAVRQFRSDSAARPQ